MSQSSKMTWPEALRRIEARAGEVDAKNLWPAESIADLAAAGAMAWAVPVSDGGDGLDALELHRRYEDLCAACLTTALAFTQRDAAVSFLAAADPTDLSRRLLRQAARGEIFVTIGISQLTTSRQHLPPAVTAKPIAGGYEIQGAVPWVTSLHASGRIIVGAVLPDSSQILFALDSRGPGVELGQPMPLAALTGSDTGEIRLHNAFVPQSDILRGPCENALAGRAAGREFALTTCTLPLGLAQGALRHAQALAAPRSPACIDAVAALAAEHQALRARIYAVAGPEEAKALGPSLRAAANSLAARATLAALELAKGHGFVAGQDAQRRAREALFFFVWSSPPAIIEQTLLALRS